MARASGTGDGGPGLPDGFFSNQKSQFGYISEGLAMEDVGKFYGKLVNFRPCGIFYGHFAYFPPVWYILHFGVFYQEKSGKPEMHHFQTNNIF
jgi:hypothetical protein